jgi:bile acid:Na+ symporter, BASS family
MRAARETPRSRETKPVGGEKCGALAGISGKSRTAISGRRSGATARKHAPGPHSDLGLRRLWRCAAGARLLCSPASSMQGIGRTLSIVSAIALGALIPQAHLLSGAIRWIVMTMLFIVFLQVRLTRAGLERRHFLILAATFAIGFASWGLGWLVGGRDLALAAFFAGITPTAIAAPVIISFLGGRVEFVVGAFLLNNITIAAVLPLLLPLVLGRTTPEVFAQVTGSVAFVVFLPMAAAWIVRTLHAPAAQWPARLRNVSFGLWIATMFLITSNASDFLRAHADTPHIVLAKIAATTLVICVTNFGVGALIGGRELRREASQSLGQKNTMFTIYLALTYASPLVALGPTCYVIWHNLWNSWQLHRAGRVKPA